MFEETVVEKRIAYLKDDWS